MTNETQRLRFLTEEWGHWCEKELVRQDECDKALDKRVRDNRDNIVALNVKAGLWGLLGGAIPVALYILIQYLT
jgi:hypothetical protein